MTAGGTTFAASRWILAVAATLVPMLPTAATRAVHPADYVTIGAVASCDDPMTLTNSVTWTVHNGNAVAVEIEGITRLSPLGTRVWQPGQTETVVTSGIDRYQLYNYTVSATVGVRLPTDLGSQFVVKDVVVPDCAADKPIVTFAETCMNVNVSMVLPSDADWPFVARILVGTGGGQHSVHLLNPGDQKTVSVPSFAGNRVAVVNARNGPVASYDDRTTRPCSSGPASSGGGSSGGGSAGGGSSGGGSSGSGGSSDGTAVVLAPSADASASPSAGTSQPASSPATSGSVTLDGPRAVQLADSGPGWWTTMMLAAAATIVAAAMVSGVGFAVLRQRRSRKPLKPSAFGDGS